MHPTHYPTEPAGRIVRVNEDGTVDVQTDATKRTMEGLRADQVMRVAQAPPEAAPTGGEKPHVGQAAVEITGREFGEGVPVADMREAARQYARKNYANTSVRNEDTESEIIIPWQGIRKTLAGSDLQVVQSMKALPDLLKRAKWVGQYADARGRVEVKAIHRFSAELRIGGEDFGAEIIVREHRDGRRFYDHYINRKKMEPTGESGESTLTGRSSVQDTAGSKGSIGPAGPHGKPAKGRSVGAAGPRAIGGPEGAATPLTPAQTAELGKLGEGSLQVVKAAVDAGLPFELSVQVEEGYRSMAEAGAGRDMVELVEAAGYGGKLGDLKGAERLVKAVGCRTRSARVLTTLRLPDRPHREARPGRTNPPSAYRRADGDESCSTANPAHT